MAKFLFLNVTFPTNCIYNITPENGSTAQGGADIEHIFEKGGKKNIWIQRRNDRVNEQVQEAIMEYAQYAETRVCNS